METIFEERSRGAGTAKIRISGAGRQAYRGRDAADSEDSSSSTASDIFDAGLDPSDTSVIVVSNVLPLDIEFDRKSQTWSARWSLDVDGTGWSGNNAWDALGFRRVVHVGVPNAYVPVDQRDEVEELLNDFDCVPVYLEAQEAHEHYQGWCKAVIWPVFHNIIDLYNASKVETRSSNVRRHSLSGPSSSSASESEQDSSSTHDAASGGGHAKHLMQAKEKDRSEWVPQKSWHPFMQEQAWPSHKAVTAKFARAVSQTHSEGDVVWIQDYHLLLLPSFLVRKLPRANIGMFLHVPFPSSEIFRTLSYREEILRSMLCSDHVGFHQFEYARHFLTCCRRMLGLSFETKAGGSICIPFNGRNVTITCSHAGIETSHLIDILRSDDAAASLRSMWDLELNQQRADTSAVVEPSGGEKDTPKTCQLIASADHAEGLRGITLKLLAFDRFLEERPHWRGRVRLLQIGIALDSRPDDARRVRKDVTELVEAINKRYEEDYPDPKWPAVTYRAVKSFPIHERLALWRISSIMLSTCVRSGLDLHPLEYVFCRGSVSGVNAGDGDDESSPFAAEPIDSPGVVVLSEFSGCCRVLNGALHVNPYSTQSVVDALDRALGMSPQERSDRRRRDIRSIYANTKQAWIKRVLSDVVASAKRQDFIYVGTGFGLKYRMLGYGRGFTPLNKEAMTEMYRMSSRRLIVIDYSGTLVEEQSMDQYMKTMRVGGSDAYSAGSNIIVANSSTANSGVVDHDLWNSSAEQVNAAAQGFGQGSLNGRLQGLPLSVERNLAALCKNPQNTVYIVSGSDGDALSLAMSGVIARLGNRSANSRTTTSGRIGLAGQHGFVFKPPGALRWKCLLDNFDAESANVWQDMALSVMESYKARTNGSYTWRNAASVGFSYYMADPEFGRLQASSLTNVLKTTLRAFSVKVVHEAGTVFCAPQGVDKGAFCARIAAGNMDSTTSSLNERPFVKSVESTRAFDFVLCMGDNLSDEHMFEVVNKFGTGSRGDSRHVGSALDQNSLSPNIGTKRRRSHRGGSAKGGVFTVTIRPKPTNAKYYVDSVEDVHDVVESLAVLERNKSSPMRKSFSLSSVNSSSGGGFVTKAQLHGVMGRGGSHRNHDELHGKKQAARKRVYRDVDTRTSKGPPGKIPSSAKSKSLTQLRRNGLTKTRAWWKSPKKLFLLWITVYLLFARRKWGARLTRYFFRRG